MADDLSCLPFRDIGQSFEERFEVPARVHLFGLSEHSADTDREPFLFWKNPAISVGNSPEIQMDELKFVFREKNG